MELNREQIIKALESCIKAQCENCCNLGNWHEQWNCMTDIMKNALALIKELTEENERLHASCTELTQECKKWQERVKIECDYTKADTVRKVQLGFAVHFGTYTHNDEVKIFEVFKLIDRISKEILEGANDNGTMQ